MARTSRGGAPSANVESLDNFNLEDMFADGGDELFDGLDIDLGNMDDITGGNAQLTAAANSNAPPTRSQPKPQEEALPKRRTTKRKTKSRFAYDDDEDYLDGPAQKKSRTAKGATRKRATKKPTSPDDMSPKASTTAKGKSKKKASSSVESASVASSVAASGQFGGRQKRGSSFSAKGRTKFATKKSADGKKAKASSTASETASSQASIQSSPDSALQNLSQVMSSHPGLTQGPFCGLLPSDTLFYPFLPTLPAETAMKSRKVFGFIDRIHSSFLSHIQGTKAAPSTPTGSPVKETDAIFKLIQEAYKDPPPTATAPNPPGDAQRIQTIGNTVAFLRRTIPLFDRPRLAADLYAICALLRRQHDFLKQNLHNMEKWCRQYLPPEEYASVYLPPKSKKRKAPDGESFVSLLQSMNKSEIKVKITISAGFKVPKGSAPLVALFPSPYGTPKQAANKKRKASSESPKSVPTTSSAAVSKAERSVPYPECRPVRRRKYIADLVARTARELEATYQQKLDERKQMITRQESELQKLAAENDTTVSLHTGGMWRWLEKSTYFASFSAREVQCRLDSVRHPIPSDDWEEEEHREQRGKNGQRPSMADSTLTDRLTSLLVEEDVCDDGDENDDVSGAFEGQPLFVDDDLLEIIDEKEVLLDVSNLSQEERVSIHLQAFGFVGTEYLARIDLASRTKNNAPNPEKGAGSPRIELVTGNEHGEEHDHANNVENETGSDVEELIRRMVADLTDITSTNNKRADFLESLALGSNLCTENSKAKKDEEASIIAKCQQIIKKGRESKVKAVRVKSVAKSDESALPW